MTLGLAVAVLLIYYYYYLCLYCLPLILAGFGVKVYW